MNNASRKNPDLVLAGVVCGVLWIFLLRHLSAYWSSNPQYSFGWLSLVISPYLFFVAWMTKPPPGAAKSRFCKVLFCIAAIALLPVWLVEQPNPDWRLVSWFLSVDVVCLTLCAVYFAGGRPWLKHFAFAVCFILATVPWPFDLEVFATEGLMRLVAATTVEILNVIGITALQHGNLIEVRTGTLGIDEACSGVRSLQATLLASLFLGELYRGKWAGRIFLIICGAVIAFVCNVGRALLLSWVGATSGIDAISKWHDPAGFSILTICFFVVWGVARLALGKPQLRRRSPPMELPSPPRKYIAALAIWMIFSFVSVEAWYRSHEGIKTAGWTFDWPVSKSHFSDAPIPQGAIDLLKFDQGRAASWMESDGSRWNAFFLQWNAGPARSRILARSSHRPEICLPSAGYKLLQDRGIVNLPGKEWDIPFHATDFECEGEKAHVYYCVWENRPVRKEPRLSWSSSVVRSASLESVLLGERNLSQQTLEVVIFGDLDSAQSDEAFRKQIGALVRVN